jgi:hypothetical protein
MPQRRLGVEPAVLGKGIVITSEARDLLFVPFFENSRFLAPEAGRS